MALIDDTVLLWTPQAGLKIREDGILKYIRTGYDMSPESSTPLFPSNNLDGSETASKQPRLVGGIAPNSKVAAANLNGESRYFTHPEISFEDDEAWSVTVVVKNNSNTSLRQYIGQELIGLCYDYSSSIYNFLTIYNGSSFINFGTIKEYVGKSIILTLVYNGVDSLSAYINGGILSTQSTTAFPFTFSGLFRSTLGFSGTSNCKIIQSTALTPTQVASLHTTLRGLYPEIESVDIGTQTWATRNFEAVATPEGNVIANVTDNADWANATVLYEAAYDAHVGTEEEKEYEGLKAAAMWCYYANNPDNGAIYSKLYNWYAAKLLDLDMQSAGFGWRVPTSAQFTALATTLGGTSVAGGKMKMTDEDYWNSPNEGATNESGFTALGSGRRGADGIFSFLKGFSVFMTTDNIYTVLTPSNASITISAVIDFKIGRSIRLIKE